MMCDRQRYIHQRRRSYDEPLDPAAITIIRILAIAVGLGLIGVLLFGL